MFAALLNGAAGEKDERRERPVSRVKTLLLWGTADFALDVRLAERSAKAASQWAEVSVKTLEGGDHFVQQDLPDAVNREIDAFLQKK